MVRQVLRQSEGTKQYLSDVGPKEAWKGRDFLWIASFSRAKGFEIFFPVYLEGQGLFLALEFKYDHLRSLINLQ